MVGPRGVAVLRDLGLAPGADTTQVGDMVVVGPSGRRVRLPCFEGTQYPGFGVAVPAVGSTPGWPSRPSKPGPRR